MNDCFARRTVLAAALFYRGGFIAIRSVVGQGLASAPIFTALLLAISPLLSSDETPTLVNFTLRFGRIVLAHTRLKFHARSVTPKTISNASYFGVNAPKARKICVNFLHLR